MVAHGAAHLQRRALAPGRAAEQVRQHRREEDRRQERERQPLAQVHLVDDVVRAHALHL